MKIDIRHLLAVATAMIAAAFLAPTASAEFGAAAFDGDVTANQVGDAYIQAGGHPYDASAAIEFNTHMESLLGSDYAFPDEDVRNLRVTLPPGLVGNPQAVPRCEPVDFFSGGAGPTECPAHTQVGMATVGLAGQGPVFRPVFGVRPPTKDVPAAFGIDFIGLRIMLEATVGPAPDYAITVTSRNVNQGAALVYTDVTLWGTPADPVHDQWRCPGFIHQTGGCPGPEDRDSPHSVVGIVDPKPFVALPTACTAPGVGLETSLEMESWQSPGEWVSASFMSHLPPGYPLPVDQRGAEQGPEGCERLAFDPSVSVEPDSTRADAAAGLSVDLRFPQGAGWDEAGALTTAHLRRATVRLPEGMSINPSAAGGLAACSDEQLGYTDIKPARCPEASKIGSVRGITPILDEDLVGEVYVGTQNSLDPESGEMFRMFMVLRGPGLIVKLKGQVSADAETGRLEATFDGNPQYPVSDIQVDLKGGPRAPLALPAECGTKTTEVELVSWAGHVRNLTDQFEIPCPAGGFEPGFTAHTTNPTGGSFSPFVTRIDRPQGQRFLAGVDMRLPKGLAAKLAGVELCPDTVAPDGTPGTCPAGSRIGSATVGSGSGSPFYLSGDVFLTGPYKGAPYGLSVQVPAKAGPFDLGMVKVRQALHVNRSTAEIDVVSDPLPQVVKGVPVRLRDVTVDVDRPGFTINPTSCGRKEITTMLTASDGSKRQASQRFQTGDCQALPFKPRLALRMTGRNRTRTGRHPGLSAVVRQTGVGEAGVEKAVVTLPKSLALAPENAQALCEFDAGTKPDLENHCPRGSIVGTAKAVTPLLSKPLSGDVFFVKNVERNPRTGALIRKLPMIVVALRGEIAINLVGKSSTSKDNRLVNTFASVPDAPITRFALKIDGGHNGILAVTRTRAGRINLCADPNGHTAQAVMDGQNGKQAAYPVRTKTPCAQAAKEAARKAAKRAAARG